MDIKTLLYVNFLGSLLAALMMYTYNQSDYQNKVYRYHTFSLILFATGYFLYLAGWNGFNFLPFWFDTAFGNAALLFGAAFEVLAVSHLCGKPKWLSHKGILIYSTFAALYSAINIINLWSSNLRIGIVTVTIGIYLTITAHLLLRITEKSKLQTLIGSMIAFTAFTNFVRVYDIITFVGKYELALGGYAQILTFFGLFLFLIISGIGIILLTKEKADNKLFEAATLDGLTGVLNRVSFIESAEKQLSVASRMRKNVALSIIDLDNFKQINDQKGHLFGDEMLIAFVDTVRSKLNAEDVFGRFGGDEFLLLMCDIEYEKLTEKLNDICLSVENIKMSNLSFSSSFGVAYTEKYKRRLHFDHLISAADRALYDAKGNGGNQVLINKL